MLILFDDPRFGNDAHPPCLPSTGSPASYPRCPCPSEGCVLLQSPATSPSRMSPMTRSPAIWTEPKPCSVFRAKPCLGPRKLFKKGHPCCHWARHPSLASKRHSTADLKSPTFTKNSAARAKSFNLRAK